MVAREPAARPQHRRDRGHAPLIRVPLASVTAEAIQWRYSDDPGVGVDDKANVWTLRDGRRIESRQQMLEWLDELGRLRTAAPLD